MRGGKLKYRNTWRYWRLLCRCMILICFVVAGQMRTTRVEANTQEWKTTVFRTRSALPGIYLFLFVLCGVLMRKFVGERDILVIVQLAQLELDVVIAGVRSHRDRNHQNAFGEYAEFSLLSRSTLVYGSLTLSDRAHLY